MFELVFFYVEWKEIITNKQKIFDCFWKKMKKKDGKNNINTKIENLEKRKKYFHKICAKKVRSKMEQQQNG